MRPQVTQATFTKPWRKGATIGLGICGAIVGIGAASFHYLGAANLHTIVRNGDSLSIPYLQVLLRAHPDDIDVRSALARELGFAGRWNEACAVLTVVKDVRGIAYDRLRLQLWKTKAAWVASLPNGTEKQQKRAQFGAELNAIASRLDNSARLSELAAFAASSGYFAQAGLAFENLARRADVPRFAPASSERQACAFKTAPTDQPGTQSVPPDAARHAVQQALDAYLAGELGAEALRVAMEWSNRDTCNADLLERTLAIAQARGEVGLAKQLAAKLMILQPANAALLSRQIDREMAAGDPASALLPATRLVALEPGEQAYRKRLASIAEWAGNPKFALQQWLMLVSDAAVPEALQNALRLSEAVHEDFVWLHLIRRAVQTRALLAPELAALAQIDSRDKVRPSLVAFLDGYTQRSDALPALQNMLAQLEQKNGNVERALAALRRLAMHEGQTLAADQMQAQILSQASRDEDAWQVLNGVRTLAAPGDVVFWSSYAQASANTHRPREAELADQRVWDTGSMQPFPAERLLAAHRGRAEYDSAIRVAREAYKRLEQPRWLLLAADVALESEQWDMLREVLQQARMQEQRFSESAMYWSLRSKSARHDRDFNGARAAYAKLVQAQPDAVTPRVDLLWLDIEEDNRTTLAAHLEAWAPDALAQPDFWPAYSSGYLKLGRASAAIPWIERRLAGDPQNLRVQAEALAILSASPASPAADILFLQTSLALQSRIAVSAGKPSTAETQLLLDYATLLRVRHEMAASDHVVATLQARGAQAPYMYVLLANASLERRQFADAGRWLATAAANGFNAPAYQSLAVALGRKDRQATAQVLAQRGDELSAGDRIAGLRFAKRPAEALAVSEQALQDGADPSGNIRAQNTELRAMLAKEFEITAGKRTLSQLDIDGASVSTSLPIEGGRISLRLARDLLDLAGNQLAQVLRSTQETASVRLSLALTPVLGRLDATVGINRARDKGRSQSLGAGKLDWAIPLSTDVSARLDVAINTMTEETAALRVLGAKHKVGLELSAVGEAGQFARVEIAGQQFQTREHVPLAKGYVVEGEIGQPIGGADSPWRVRVSGAWQRNRLAPGSDVFAQIGLRPEDVVPARFGTLGAGTTLILGRADTMSGQPNATLDAWLGRQWPERGLAFALRANAELPIARHGRLQASAFYTNVQGEAKAKASHGVALTYRVAL